MYGILIELLLSYLLLKYLAKTNLQAIGFLPSGIHLLQLLVGILWAILYHCCFEYGLSLLVHNPWKLNPAYGIPDFWSSFAYLLRSVVYEELIFRGALLYLLIQRFGGRLAMLVSALSFGVYHWFAWQAWGNPVQMLMILATTGSVGFVFAYAFYRSRSVYLPIGLHFGNNLGAMVIFSKSDMLGKQLLLKQFVHDLVVPNALISLPALFLHFAGFQLLTWLMLKWYFSWRKLAP